MEAKKIIFVALTLVGCSKVKDDERLVQKDLSFGNFKVFTNTEMPKDSVDESVFTPPFSDETQVGEGDSSWILKLFDWVPTGAYASNLTRGCHFSVAEKIMMEHGVSNRKQSDNFQAWISKCEPELSRHNSEKFKVLLDFATAKYSMIENKNLTKVRIDLSNGYIVRGILGLKRDGKKRPLILIQSGVHSNAEDGPSSRNIIMQLFDEAPFNVLFIGSVTGRDFLEDNGVLTLGGIDEGRNLIEIAQMIRSDAPFKELVSEIHVLGISLGGHGALYSSLYNSFLPEKPIESVMAFCPVNNLGPTVESVFDNSIRGWYYNKLTVDVFKSVYNNVPILGQLLDWGGDWSRDVTKAAVQEGTFRHYRAISQYQDWTYPPFNKVKVEKKEDLWNLSQFVNQVDSITTPLTVAYSADDYLVLPNINSNVLLEKLKTSPKENIGVIRYAHGNHCAAAISDGWPTLSSMFRTYFVSRLKNSGEVYDPSLVSLKDFIKYNKAPLNQKLPRGYEHTKLDFTAYKKKNYARLQFTIYNPDGGDTFCRVSRPISAPLRCYKKEYLDIPLNAFAGADVRMPTNSFEEQYLTRWLNTRVEVLNSKNENLLGDREWPMYLKINGRYDY